MRSRWRNYARPIIVAVLQETQGQDESAVRKALREAYPFGERRCHPYRMWLAEIRHQTGKPAELDETPLGGLFEEER